MFVWMAIFFPQPHKEERFLFPVYPMLCLAAAMSAVLCARMVAAIAGRLHAKVLPPWESQQSCHPPLTDPLPIPSSSRDWPQRESRYS